MTIGAGGGFKFGGGGTPASSGSGWIIYIVIGFKADNY